MAGRRNKYDDVKKHIPEIMQWRRQDGLSEGAVAEKLGISQQTLYKYKTMYPEFKRAMDLAKKAIVNDTFAALFKRAKGYSYEERKVYRRNEGGKAVEYVEVTKKQEPPNVAACSLLLKNLDREHDWSDNPAMLALKREEQELRKQLAEAEKWEV